MTDEWKLARRGRLTASSRARSIGGPKAVQNFPKLRDKIMAELDPGYRWVEQQFAATEWGNAHEREALSNLELLLGLDPEESYEPGFMLHPTRPYVGCTPDLLIDTPTGGWDDSDPVICRPTVRRCRTSVQMKCPHDKDIHARTLHTGKLHEDAYRYQIQWEGWVSGADRLLFVSYDPRQKRRERQLVQVHVPVDYEMRKIFERRCDEFRAFVEGGTVNVRPVGIDSLAAYF